MPKYPKGTLITCLEEFRFTIIAYRLRGVAGLRKATEETIGALVTNKPEVTETTQRGEESKKVIFDLIDFVNKAGKIVEIATKLKELAVPIISWLLPG